MSMASRGPPLSQQSMRESLSYLTETPIEEYVAKYQVIKVSWRGKYERIFALGPTRFCTFDPKDFEVTNTWSLAALLNVSLDENDAEGFTLFLKGPKKDEQLKLRCRFRSHLLSDLYRQLERSSTRNTRVQTQFPCSKWTRTGVTMDGLLELGKDGVLFLRRDGTLRSKYLYVEMQQVSVVSGSTSAFAIGYGGRPRLFFSDRRNIIIGQINSAAESLGLKLASRSGFTIERVQQERHMYGTDVGQPFVQFQVLKLTRKHSTPVDRILSLHQKYLVELDLNGGVVSCFPYSQIYVLVRSPRDRSTFEVQFVNGALSSIYTSSDRDGVLAAIYDLCVTCNENAELFITNTPNVRGLRLLPCFATEDTAETHLFFGDTSIGICFLQRMTAVGKISGSRKSSDRGFISIVQEFNANVPASGILYDTKQSIIVEALRPIGAQLFYLTKGSPIASQSAVMLLQALFRISSSFYGFREVAQIPQLTEILFNLLTKGDEFAVFWTTLVLKRLTAHVPPAAAKLDAPSLRSSEEVEAYNKSLLFGGTQVVRALVEHLQGVDIKGASPLSEPRFRIGPLVIMGMLQTLEGCLCSRKATTAPSEFQMIVAEVANFYSTLLKTLFQSRCATTVEACTLLLKAIVEECEPAVARQIRDAALAEGIVLRHFYQAVFDPSFDQRSVSRYLISLWMSHHPPSKQLLARMLPTGFLPLLAEAMPSVAELQEIDRIEREQGNGSVVEEILRFSSLSDEQMYGHEGWSNNGEMDTTRSSSSERPVRSSSFSLFVDAPPLPLDRRSMASPYSARPVNSTQESVALQIENDYTKSRMLQKLQSSVLGSSRSGTNLRIEEDRSSESLRSRGSFRSGVKRDSFRAGTDDVQRMRKRDVAYDFISNAISKSKTQRPHPTKIKRHSKTNGHAHVIHDDREPENFRLLFYTLAHDHERVDLIWNASTRAELKRALLREIQQFGLYQHSRGSGKAVWNYEDFKVEYASLRKEPVVGGCYLRVLADLLASQKASTTSGLFDAAVEDSFLVLTSDQIRVKDPKTMIERLYRRILRENVRVEYHHDLDRSLACTQGLTVIAAAYAGFDGSTELDEIDYLVQLMLDTVHTPILESLLQAVRALSRAKGNARRLLSKESIVDTIIRLLQLGHVADRANSIASAKQVWRITNGSAEDEVFSVEELRQAVQDEKLSVETCQVVRVDDSVCERVEGDELDSLHVMDALQLRWEIGIQGKLSPLQVAHDAIEILLSIAHSNALLENPTTKKSLFPVVRSKVALWKRVRDILPLLARYNYPQLCQKAAKLLNFLYDEQALYHQRLGAGDDVTQRSSLHLWGLYYMAFLVDTPHYDDFAGLLKATHLYQEGLNGISALVGILPQAMIGVLETASPQFVDTFVGDVSSPQVVWNRDMRKHLRESCLAHMDDYLEYLQEDVRSHWRFCPMAPVTYTNLENEVWCDSVYLGKFCERDDFVIEQPATFMRQLSRKWRHEADRKGTNFTYESAADLLGVPFQSTARSAHPSYRAAFKRCARQLQDDQAEGYANKISDLREAYRVVTSPRDSLLTDGHDPVRLLLVLRVMVEMCSRYAPQLTGYDFDCYDLLLALLDSHCTATGTPPMYTTEEQRLDLAAHAAELLYQTCAVSARNGDVLLKQHSDLDTLERVVHFCVDAIIADPDSHDTRFERVGFFVLQTITGLLASQAGRMWVSDSSTLLVDMARLLWFWNHLDAASSRGYVMSKAIQQVLESISRMTMLKVNQDRMLQTGVVWQLLLLLSRYNITLGDTVIRLRLGTSITSEGEYETMHDDVQNLLAIMAVRALCRLGGLFVPESELACPRDDHLAAAMDALMTPNLARLLLLDSHHEFLKIFHGDYETYTLYWNEETRRELLNFVRPRCELEPTVDTHETYDDAVQFRFECLASVFTLGEIYVDALISSFIVLHQSEVPSNIQDLGLTDRFFRELFSFIDNGRIQYPTIRTMTDEGVQEFSLQPHSGWRLPQETLESTLRVTALNCCALASSIVPILVGRHVVGDSQIVKMLLRLLFPPDNDVHQTEDGEEKNLIFSEELYEPACQHCLMILMALSMVNDFGRVSYEVGIFDILVEVVSECRGIGPQVLMVLRNLCRTSTRSEFITDILQTGTYIEFIGWIAGVEHFETDEERQEAEALRIPAADLLGEMARTGQALSAECEAVLNRFFPAAMIDALISEPRTFIHFYEDDHATPELLWDTTSRDFLRGSLVGLLNDYYVAASVADELAEPTPEVRQAKARLDTHVVDYANVYPEPMVGNVYLNLYLRNPGHKLRDPVFFINCLWTEFETLFGDLAHISSSLRQTRSPDDDMMAETADRFLDLVTACMVCGLRTNTWVLGMLPDAKIVEKCCGYLNECVRQNLSESCGLAVVRLLRVLSTSRKCVAVMQPMCSSLISCLLTLMNPYRGGPLYRESAYTIEIVRRVVMNFPSTIANGEGIVTLAMRVDLFNYLLNFVENPGVLGPVRQPNLVRAIAIDILNMLEKDRIQARTARDILKKNKKWEKKYRHEGMAIQIPSIPEDPFLLKHSPDLDRLVSESALKNPSVRPAATNRSVISANPSMRGTMMERFRNSPRQRAIFASRLDRVAETSSNGGGQPNRGIKKLFSRVADRL